MGGQVRIKYILICLLLAAVSVFVYSLNCDRSDKQPTAAYRPPTNTWVAIPRSVPTTDTVTKTLYVPIVQTPPHDTVFIGADTAQILREYFTKSLYKEVYSDSAMEIEITDSIAHNRLVSQSVRYKTKIPPVQPAVQLWAGIIGDTRKTAGVALYLKDTKERLYGVGFSTDKSVCFSVAVPLFKSGGTR